MGDPDGARNILKEVLQEGSVGQKQEAQRLIDSLPG
jgi:FimV-like protein